MTEKQITLIIVGTVGCLLTIARRLYNKEDPDAGCGIAAGTLLLLFAYMIDQ